MLRAQRQKLQLRKPTDPQDRGSETTVPRSLDLPGAGAMLPPRSHLLSPGSRQGRPSAASSKHSVLPSKF